MLRKRFTSNYMRILKLATIICSLLFFTSFVILPFNLNLFMLIIGVLGGLVTVFGALIALIPETKPTLLRDHFKSRNDILDWLIINRVERFFHNTTDGAIELEIKKELLIGYDYQSNSSTVINNQDNLRLDNINFNHLYNNNRFAIVLVGGRGSGKTYLVRQLLRSLVEEAKRDIQKSIPLFLNLSSWSKSYLDLNEWIKYEVYQQTGIRKEITDQWLKEDMIILLLDALDEVFLNDRQACVDSINDFIDKHENFRLVVTSRRDEYEALPNKINIPTVINLLPLDTAQIQQYLTESRANLAIQLLSENKELLELTKIPLILRLITLTYNEKQIEGLMGLVTIEQRLSYLFDSYISYMFEHRPLKPEIGYDKRQAWKWLSRIAIKMKKDGRSEFFIENINEKWLNSSAQRWYYALVSIVGMLLILPVGAFAISSSLPIIFSMIVGSPNIERTIFIGRISGVTFVIIGLIQMVFQKEEMKLSLKEKIQLRFPTGAEVLKYLGSRTLYGLGIGLLIGGLSVYFGFFSGVEMILANSLSAARVYKFVQYGLWTPNELARWVSFIIMPAIGFVAGLVVGTHHLIDGITETTSVTERMRPNLGIYLSLQNSFYMAGLYILTITPLLVAMISVFLFLFGETDLPAHNFLKVLGTLLVINSMAIAVAGWWINGGRVVFQHYFIRYLLDKSNELPYSLRTQKLVEYLDAMSERFLLRRVGGGWEFYHRLLYEKFIAINTVIDTSRGPDVHN